MNRKYRLVALAIALTGAVTLSIGATSKPKKPTFAKTYALKHAAATRVESKLTQLLRDGNMKVDVFVDRRRNRLVVEGTDNALKVADQTILALDQPARPIEENQGQPGITKATNPEPAVLRRYVVAPDELTQTTAQLRQRFGARPNVRIVGDERSSQILVMAPEDVQQSLSELLGPSRSEHGNAANTQVPQTNQANTAAAEAKSVTSNMQLRYLPTAEFQRGLNRLWGRPLDMKTSENGKIVKIQLAAENGDGVVLELDRSTGRIQLTGQKQLVAAWVNVVRALDSPERADGYSTELVPLREAKRDTVQGALRVFQTSDARAAAGAGTSATLVQAQGDEEDAGQVPPNQPGQPQEEPLTPQDVAAGGLIGPVQIEFLEGLDVIVVRGHQRDVQRVLDIIDDIERLSRETEPVHEVRHLKWANSTAVATLISTLYTDVLAARQGTVSVTALVKPNALLLIGREENLPSVNRLIDQLDTPVSPETEFTVIRLKHNSAETLSTSLEEFYAETGDPTGLAARVRTITDWYTNSIIAQGSPRDLAEFRHIVAEMDSPASGAENQLKVIPLRNQIAEELAPILQRALLGMPDPTALGGGAGVGAGGFGGAGAGDAASQVNLPRSIQLVFQTFDAEGKEILQQAGIASTVRINADPNANALIVSAPPKMMPLLEKIISALDELPAADAVVKVFEIVQGDATSLAEMLQDIFGDTDQFGQAALESFAGGDEGSLAPLRFAVDEISNSIIVIGAPSHTYVVEAILKTLDQTVIEDRITTVYRLLYTPAPDVATALQQYLVAEQDIDQLTAQNLSPFRQVERQVIVVPEPYTNTLVVAATEKHHKRIMQIIKEIDQREPMVLIKVLIAEVDLGDRWEKGIEWGLQDSLLFDRSNTDVDNNLVPGFDFNNDPLGNADTADSRATRGTVLGQGLSSFALSRMNSELGWGGLVLSASSDALSVLIRALQEDRRVDILSSPQITAMNYQVANILVGQLVPRVDNIQTTQTGTVNSTVLDDVGLIVNVEPRISPDGYVTMIVTATKSSIGPIDQGIPVGTNIAGDVIRQPIYDIITTNTSVIAQSGQTVVLGGLITNTKQSFNRSVPYLSDIPYVGDLFHFKGFQNERSELILIMTPYIIRGEEDLDTIKHMEYSRMSWCVSDIYNVHGDIFGDGDMQSLGRVTETIYPDMDPTAEQPVVEPTPAEQPLRNPSTPMPQELDAPLNPGPPGATMHDPPVPGTIPQVHAASFGGRSRPAYQAPMHNAINQQPTAAYKPRANRPPARHQTALRRLPFAR